MKHKVPAGLKGVLLKKPGARAGFCMIYKLEVLFRYYIAPQRKEWAQSITWLSAA